MASEGFFLGSLVLLVLVQLHPLNQKRDSRRENAGADSVFEAVRSLFEDPAGRDVGNADKRTGWRDHGTAIVEGFLGGRHLYRGWGLLRNDAFDEGGPCRLAVIKAKDVRGVAGHKPTAVTDGHIRGRPLI